MGHANPVGGAQLLINDIQAVSRTPVNIRFRSRQEVIVYYSQMSRIGFRGLQLGVGTGRKYAIKIGIDPLQVKSVALAIFMGVSISFESMQSNWLFNKVSTSGFSVEDLVSDLIGFYIAIYPGEDVIAQCDPVSKEEAFAIWDAYGPVGNNKNYDFNPMFFPDPRIQCGKPIHGRLPFFLERIRPAIEGDDYRRIE